jgi:hypothetical protein
LIAFEEEG